jgi:hypothetical protein
MNEAMRQAWLEISQMLGETTPEELDVFLRTWQRAMQAEREECAKVCEQMNHYMDDGDACAAAIRARGQA